MRQDQQNACQIDGKSVVGCAVATNDCGTDLEIDQ